MKYFDAGLLAHCIGHIGHVCLDVCLKLSGRQNLRFFQMFVRQVLVQTESDVDMQLPGVIEAKPQQWVGPASKVKARLG